MLLKTMEVIYYFTLFHNPDNSLFVVGGTRFSLLSTWVLLAKRKKKEKEKETCLMWLQRPSPFVT
jgi:LPXTG-motif cell wall-anchored protein